MSKVKLSGAWGRKQLQCTLEGITRLGGCGGHCCKNTSFWPPSSGATAGGCPHLTETGCALGDRRPIKCLLYPYVPNKSGTLVMHYRGRIGCCKPNTGVGPPMVVAIQPQLAVLFGEEEAIRIVNAVLGGHDAEVEISPFVQAQLAREEYWERNNLPPLAWGAGE